MPDGTLTKHDRNLWTVARPFSLVVGDIGTRMTVIRLGDGNLFVHSPVPLDTGLKEELDRVGTVRFIVGPSKVHHLYLGDYVEAYPEADLWGAPGLAEKRKDLRFHRELSDDCDDSWGREVLAHLFGGFSVANEVVFFHPSTRSLLLTDLAFNVPNDHRNRARLYHWLVGATGRFGPHRLVRLGIRDKTAAKRSLQRILEWDFDRVILTHGEIVQTGGKALMKEGFSYLLNRP